MEDMISKITYLIDSMLTEESKRSINELLKVFKKSSIFVKIGDTCRYLIWSDKKPK